MNIDFSDMSVIDSAIILSQGVFAATMTFSPFFKILLSAMKDLNTKSIKEPDELNSMMSLFFKMIVSLSLLPIVYFGITGTIELFLPDLAPISGKDGITAYFWQIDSSYNENGTATEQRLTNVIILTKQIIEILAISTTILMGVFSMKFSFFIMSAKLNDKQRTGFSTSAVLITLVIGFTIHMFIIEYYALATASILNISEDDNVRTLALAWIQTAFNTSFPELNI